MTLLLAAWGFIRGIKPAVWLTVIFIFSILTVISLVAWQCSRIQNRQQIKGIEKKIETHSNTATEYGDNGKILEGEIIEKERVIVNSTTERQQANKKVDQTDTNLKRARVQSKHRTTGANLDEQARNYNRR